MTASEEQLANGGAVGNETGSEAADMQLIAEHTNGHPVEEPQSSSSSDSGAGGEERLVLRVILEVDDGVNQPMQSTQPSAQEELETLRQEVSRPTAPSPAVPHPLTAAEADLQGLA
jgi:hypothetical protein